MKERAEGRPAAILAAARQAVLDRGLGAVRVADIADLANVSSGSVHYHFDTKDDVLVASFLWSAERLFEVLDRRLAGVGDAADRLSVLLQVSVPDEGLLRDEYVIWLQFWARVVYERALLAPLEAVSERWRSYFYTVIADGFRRGEFRSADAPDDVADWLMALVDGLGFETVVGYRWTSPARMRALLERFSETHLGRPLPVPARSGDAARAKRAAPR